MGFNVCLVRWPGPVPYFEAYREIAETVWHGLRRLGHDAILSDNRIAAERRNIVLGFHALAPKELPQLPESTILYQLEQVVQGELKPVFHAIGDQFTVWDYSVRNMERLRPIGVTRSVHVPIGYVPELSRIDAAADQNIDVLFYGLVEQRRGRVIEALMDAGLTVKVLQGVYGAERDKYIARSKVVLNMHLYEARIFEVARVSYLLANAKAVVSECGEHTEIEDGFRDALALVDYEDLVRTCVELVRDTEKRKTYEEKGFAIMSSRDECNYLKSALECWPGSA